MPLETLVEDNNSAWAIWKISEDEKTLAAEVAPYEQVPEGTTNERKRLEFLAGRVVLKNLLRRWNLPYKGLRKDEFGKPFFLETDLHLSLTHSFPYVAAIVNRIKEVGIDLEQPKQKLLGIAPRVLDQREAEDAGTDLVKHCIYWCSKEALIKFHGKKDLTFAKHLQIEPFQRFSQGYLTGRVLANHTPETVPLHYRVYDNFVIVITI
jgi:4'-phosphopantetheinyl transferase